MCLCVCVCVSQHGCCGVPVVANLGRMKGPRSLRHSPTQRCEGIAIASDLRKLVCEGKRILASARALTSADEPRASLSFYSLGAQGTLVTATRFLLATFAGCSDTRLAADSRRFFGSQRHSYTDYHASKQPPCLT